MADNDPQTPAELADTAAEAIRALNHATLDPADNDSTIAALKQLAQRLPQAIEKVQGVLDRLETQGRLRHDSGDPEKMTQQLRQVRAGLSVATASAHSMTTGLEAAHNALSPIGYQD